MPTIVDVNVAYLTEVMARIQSGAATAADLAALSKGLKLIEGNADWQAVVAGLADAAIQEIGDASDSIADAAATLGEAQGAIANVVTANTANVFRRNTGPFAISTGANSWPWDGTQGWHPFQSPVLIDARDGTRTFMVNYYRTYAINSGPNANSSSHDYRMEWGYFDDRYEWVVVASLASMSSYTTPKFLLLPLKTADSSAVRVCLVRYTASAPLQVTRWDGTSATLFTTSESCTNGVLVYDRTQMCLYFHDNANFIRCFADAAAADTGRGAAGVWSLANWKGAFYANRARYVDLDGTVDTHSAVLRHRRWGFWSPWSLGTLADPIGTGIGLDMKQNSPYAVVGGSNTNISQIWTQALYRDIGNSTFATPGYGKNQNVPTGHRIDNPGTYDAYVNTYAGHPQVRLNSDTEVKFQIVQYQPVVKWWQGTTHFASNPWQVHGMYRFPYIEEVLFSVVDENGAGFLSGRFPFALYRPMGEAENDGYDYWAEWNPWIMFVDSRRRVAMARRQVSYYHPSGGGHNQNQVTAIPYFGRF